MSSEDYHDGGHINQGHVKKTVTSLHEYSTSGATDYNRKPPSPSPKRRTPQPAVGMPSPRRSSPSPGRRGGSPPHAHGGIHTTSSSNYSYNYNSTRGSSPPTRRRSPSPRAADPAPRFTPREGEPTGHAYYNKYHSSYASSQQQQQNNTTTNTLSFPTCPSPRPGATTPSLQSPPKKVDDLLTELSEFDPSIRPGGFVEPPLGSSSRTTSKTTYLYDTRHAHDEDDWGGRSSSAPAPRERRVKDPSPPPSRPSKQQSTPGPAVYYPPGEIFTSTRRESDSVGVASNNGPGGVSHVTTLESSGAASRGRAKARAEYGYKEKGRYSESEGKQGAAVVPICLPLCCAAPCVIL